MKRWLIALVAYGAIAVVTFGYAAAKNERRYQSAHCATMRADATQWEGACEIDDAALRGGLGAILWPLYWSWEAFS